MKEYNISAQPISFLSIQELRMEEEIGEHGKLKMEGYIADEMEEKYLALLAGDVWELRKMVRCQFLWSRIIITI